MVDLQDVNPSNDLHDVVRQEDSKESRLLLSDEIHL
jgi:hypothetical protein